VLAWLPAAAWPQAPARIQKVGILSPGKQVDMVCGSNNQGMVAGCFADELRTLGYEEGRNVAFVYRFAEGASDRLPALADELVALQPDVIFTHTPRGAEAAARATRSIPIVVAPAGEATLEKLAGNFARPAGNVTGLTLNNRELEQKCLQLLKELAPRTSRVAVLVNPDEPSWRNHPAVLTAAANQLGMVLVRIDARNASELESAFAAMVAARADAIYMVDDAALAGSSEVRRRTTAWALLHRVPVASSSSRVTADGGLVSVGTDIAALARRGAHYVDRLLDGAKPSELPIERPTIYKLSINRATSAKLGLAVPQALLLRADEVIR
jgi:putative ABC transport system substrate-binding protein